MNLEDVRTFAKSHRIKAMHGRRSITELIISIQTDKVNFDRFAAAPVGECNRAGCLLREDCLDAAHK